MSAQSGQSGIGIPKHGVSGHSHKPARTKQAIARDADAEAADRADARAQRRATQNWADSVSDLLGRTSRKRRRRG